jgi:hypothetical protein
MGDHMAVKRKVFKPRPIKGRSDLFHEGLARLEGYEILPTPKGFDAYTLILWTKDRRFECIADHQSLLKLAASIQTHVVPPKYLIS